jgi:hypothetical protein
MDEHNFPVFVKKKMVTVLVFIWIRPIVAPDKTNNLLTVWLDDDIYVSSLVCDFIPVDKTVHSLIGLPFVSLSFSKYLEARQLKCN